jgi:anti-anti-sigma regulatory factor
MNKLIDDYQVRVMAVDLSGVKLVPSGMLGLLTTIRKKVDRVELYNPSDDVREVLRITNLEKLFDIKSVEL